MIEKSRRRSFVFKGAKFLLLSRVSQKKLNKGHGEKNGGECAKASSWLVGDREERRFRGVALNSRRRGGIL